MMKPSIILFYFFFLGWVISQTHAGNDVVSLVEIDLRGENSGGKVLNGLTVGKQEEATSDPRTRR